MNMIMPTPPPESPFGAMPVTPASVASGAEGMGMEPMTPESVTITAPGAISGVAAIVNDYVISDYDLNQRTALFLATSGVRATHDTLPQIRGQVLRSLEDEILELQEAQKHKIIVTKADVDKAIKNIADDNHVATTEVMETIKRAGVADTVFRQQVAAQLTWQQVVTARYGTDILVTDEQVNEAMDRLKKGSDKPQYLLSEIYIAVDRPEEDAMVHASATQIAQQIHDGAPFAAVATQFSQSPSAADGGNIGWVTQGQLSEELDKALLPLRPGSVAGPVHAEGGYYLLLVRDRREPVGSKMMQEAAAPLPNNPNGAIPLDRLLIPLPPNPSAMIKERAMALAENVRKEVRACSDLPAVSKALTGTIYTSLGRMQPGDLAKDLRDALAKSQPGEIVQPYFSPAGLEIIMRCDPAPPKPVAFKLPTHDELQNQIFVQQMSLFAKSYLRELRRDAVVETR
jgi:peptidyl-prolyl cis-trans isomerase SurA